MIQVLILTLYVSIMTDCNKVQIVQLIYVMEM
jgi:hypothetical protein